MLRTPKRTTCSWRSGKCRSFIRASGGRAVFCTTFDPSKFNQPGFTRLRRFAASISNSIRALSRSKSGRTSAWRSRTPTAITFFPTIQSSEPIYKDIAAHNKTLVAHVADPDSAWQPPNPASPDYSYYKDNPIWYMYGKPHPASKMQILRARDHLLEQNPNLRVVGAHLGSMEADFAMLAQHLDRYPNFAVDLAARMPYLALQPRADAIAFVLKYQDKLIYGSDLVFPLRRQARSSR